MTVMIMLGIVIALMSTMLVGINYSQQDNRFFDKENTNAMRGFWSLIIILVHIPSVYQNQIQDMLGSFAYIGVTFFFMTSAYGLKMSLRNSQNKLRFWRRRLIKILVPCITTNIVSIIVLNIIEEKASLSDVVHINDWVKWLLVCYGIFEIVNIVVPKEKNDKYVCVGVLVFSLMIYILKMIGIFESTTWCSEIFGFVWGIIFASKKEEIYDWINEKWQKKVMVGFIGTLMIGIFYLKFKNILFLGDYVLKIILGLAIIFFVLILNTRMNLNNRISRMLGKISYETYLLQWTMIPAISCLGLKESGVYILMLYISIILVAYIVNGVDKKIFEILR
ncbi:acyltransferase [uncultured Eubacterium sp.]|uniref:acyltransferase family protein n=1 Tax=uncultured Eubacterium sp. TaxID=165185 RepID=UPI002594746E|nr:acyltransferase family protein [uncultured Eubacterium sp.]